MCIAKRVAGHGANSNNLAEPEYRTLIFNLIILKLYVIVFMLSYILIFTDKSFISIYCLWIILLRLKKLSYSFIPLSI